jgi:hypothetical protein
MNDGVYLLHCLDDDFARPLTMTTVNGTTLLSDGCGVRLLSNLPPGYVLTPMVAMTEKRIAAITLAVSGLDVLDEILGGDNRAAAMALRLILAEVEP